MADNGPVCKEPVYRRDMSEDITPGTHIASIVSWDADEGTAARSRYTLTGDGAEHFSIDQLSGHVATATQLDRETQDSYALTVSTPKQIQIYTLSKDYSKLIANILYFRRLIT